MKKILLFICAMALIGFHETFAQQVDVYFDQPIDYNQIPTKHVEDSYGLRANYVWVDGVSFTEDTLNVTETISGDAFGENFVEESDIWPSAPSSFPDTVTNQQIDTVDANTAATFALSAGANNFNFTGAWELGNSTGTVTALGFSVEVTDDTYRRYDGGADATNQPNQYGSIGAQYWFQVDDFVESLTVEFDNAAAANTEFNVSVYSVASPTASTGTLVYTSPIQLIPSTGTEVVEIPLNLDLTAGSYVFMINQLTTNTFEIISEAAADDGQVVFFDVNDEFDRDETGDIHTFLTTSSPAAPEFSSRFPGDMMIFQVGETTEYTISATDEDDPDGSGLTFDTLDVFPDFNEDWFSITNNGDGTATISGTPDISNIGTVQLDIEVTDGSATIYYNTEFGGQLEARVVNSVAFAVPFSEDFNSTATGEIPNNWQLSQDVDGNGNLDPQAASWRESGNEMIVTQDDNNSKQNEWLVTPPVTIPAVTGSEQYELVFDFDLDDVYNFIGGNPEVLGSGSDGDGNFADFTVWVWEEDGTLTSLWTDDDYAEELDEAGGSVDDATLSLNDYAGQDLRIVFQYTSNNGGEYDTDLAIDNVSIEVNDDTDLSVIVRVPYNEIPRSQIDTVGGIDLTYWVINRGSSIPDDAILTYSVSSSDDPNFADIFVEDTLEASDFVNDTLVGTVNVILSIPDNGDDFEYEFVARVDQDDNVPTGDDEQFNYIYVGSPDQNLSANINNALSKTILDDEGATDVEDSEGLGAGIGTVIELVQDDYLGGFYVNFDDTGDEYTIKVIALASADATSGTLVAEIDEYSNGDPLESGLNNNEVELLDDEDFDNYLKLDAGFYAILVSSNSTLELNSSDPSDDRADAGSFVRGDEDDLYSLEDDDGDVDIRVYFSDYINYSVIADTEYEEIPRTQIDLTNGYDFEGTIIKRGNSTPSLLVTGVISSDNDDWEDVEFENIIDASVDFAGTDTVTLVYNFQPWLVDDDDNDTYTFTIEVEHLGDDDTDNNSAYADSDQSEDLRVGDATADFNSDEDNSLGGFLGYDEDEDASGDFGDGLGEVFELTNDDYLSAIYIGWASGGGNEDISVSIISVTDENATSGTVVAVIDEDGVNNPLEANDNTYIQVEDDPDFDKDIFLEAGYYVIMVNPVDDADNDWAIQGSSPNDDKEDFGSFVRGNENDIYTDDDDDGNLDIRMYFRDNSAPQFFDPRGTDGGDGGGGVDISTAVSDITLNIVETVADTARVLVKDPQEFDTFTIEQVNTNLSFLTINTDAAGFDIIVAATAPVGEYSARIMAFDKLDTAFFTIYIDVEENPAPQFTTAPVLTATEGTAYSYTATGTDALGETVTAAADVVPAWLTATVSGDSVTVAGTPDADDVGTHAVKLRLTDASGRIAQQSYVITVSANTPPKFKSTPETTGVEGFEYEYRVVATDNEGDALSYNVTDPTGFTFTDMGGGVGMLESASLPAGTTTVTIEVTDGINAVQQVFDIVVASTNTAPTIDSAPSNDPDTATVGTVYEYMISASDADGDAVQFNYTAMPSWLQLQNLGGGTARIYGNPTNPGDYNVSFYATDGQDGSAAQAYVVRVVAAGSVADIDEEDTDEEEAAQDIADDQDEVAAEIAVWPNPTDEEFIQIHELEEAAKAVLFDQSGSVVKEVMLQKGDHRIDISDVENGIYFLKIGGSKTTRVVIE